MTELQAAIAQVAPFYNVAFVIVILLLFAKLFSLRKKMYLLPWKLLFFAIIVFIIEQSLVILNQQKIVTVAPVVFPLFETVIISAFVYMVLNQKVYLQRRLK